MGRPMSSEERVQVDDDYLGGERCGGSWSWIGEQELAGRGAVICSMRAGHPPIYKTCHRAHVLFLHAIADLGPRSWQWCEVIRLVAWLSAVAEVGCFIQSCGRKGRHPNDYQNSLLTPVGQQT